MCLPSSMTNLVAVVRVTSIVSMGVVVTWYTQNTTVCTVIMGITVNPDQNPGSRAAPAYLEYKR
jgi:hypothetical protein